MIAEIPKATHSPIILRCDFCGREFTRQPSWVRGKHHFCNRKCQNDWQAVHYEGANNPHYGKKVSEKTKAIMRRKRQEYWLKPENKEGFCQSEEFRERMSKIATKRWQDPNLKARASIFNVAGGRKTMSNPANRRVHSILLKEQWSDPSYRARIIENMSRRMLKLWQDPTYRQDTLLAQAKGQSRKPNKIERRLQSILDKYFPGQWEYTGDGKLLIYGMRPDFANCDGRKDLIELFGDYWHGKRARKWAETELGKIMAYNSLDYRCLVIWGRELKDESNLIRKVANFMRARKC